jgi:hypothetical protein
LVDQLGCFAVVTAIFVLHDPYAIEGGEKTNLELGVFTWATLKTTNTIETAVKIQDWIPVDRVRRLQVASTLVVHSG